VEHLERVRARAKAVDLKLAFVSDKAELYSRLVGLLIARNTVEQISEAYEIVELAKSRTLLEELLLDGETSKRLRRPNRLQRLEQRARDSRARLRALYAEAYGAADTPTGDSVLRSGQEGAVAQLESEYARTARALQLAMRSEQEAGRDNPDQHDAAGWPVPGGTTLIEYYAVESEMVAFVKTGTE
jgi:hypothetical protein